ncbi:hypothetical protein PLICRDRAFT_178973 [Plicaturopsis crispa FD-325 SS-3]|uniref:Zf-C3HC-domain-containing protein n=1 Tax=Plicaturopsis crispa FD-325 SS-3 TaxID=944288 RepID=A0A0C9SLC3_PLICR|nr:hypothetical protein PLICRDRAFT_178973 [Plicaturopsis crispa FD-325 SS-3]
MSSTETNESAPSSSVERASSIRATKRKLDEALHSLDDAVGSSESTDRPSPAKKIHTARTIYSTLAKYGIKQKAAKESTPRRADTLTKSTPHLSAILARTANRTRKALPFKVPGGGQTPAANFQPPTHSASEYRPSSTPSFLARLSTFKLSTYANKPPSIDAVAASKCGWVNDGKDRLVCGICNVSWVVAGRDGMSRDAANALVEKQRASLVDMHKNGCPWRTRQCDDMIYRIPLKSPAAMARDLKGNALALDDVLQGVQTKHPITANQVQLLRSALSLVSLPPPDTDAPHSPASESAPDREPSEAAILTALFGWALAPPPPERPRLPSQTRSSSVLPLVAATPMRSRSQSLVSSRAGTPIPGTPRTLRFESPFPVPERPKRDTSLLHCTLCQRRIGLWAFAPPPESTPLASDGSIPLASNGSATAPARAAPPQRQFDLLKEHRSYCPYVVRSTVVPSLPVPVPSTPGKSSSSSVVSQLNGTNGSALEGWRAVLSVVLRYGLGQRQRLGLARRATTPGTNTEGNGDAMDVELDGVEAMVAGVKHRGGKELLNYVKGLLG